MIIDILQPDKDPMGKAIADFHVHPGNQQIKVVSSQFDDDVIPVKHLFRSYQGMSPLEQKALSLATGRILDTGGGSGCHSLYLQENGKEVSAIDISPLAVETMKKRGVNKAKCTSLFNPTFGGTFDTILMLMNGSGIIGEIGNVPRFFDKIKLLLSPEGVVLMDSSDLRYLYENEDGSYDINLADSYYGEVDFRMEYKNIKGDTFNWLYIDFETLQYYAAEYGFKAEMVAEGEHYDYLARISFR